MKFWKAGLMFLISYVVQCSLLNIFAIGGYTPNLLLACAIVLTFLYDDHPYVLVLSAVFGLLYDISYGMIVGPTALSIIAVCLLVKFLRYSANLENIINMFLTGIFAIVLYYVTNWLLILLTGLRPSLIHSVYTMLFAGIYTLLVVLIAYMIMRKSIIRRRRENYFLHK